MLSRVALEALVDDLQSHWDEVKSGHNVNEGTWLQAGLLPNIHHLSERCRDLYWCGPVVDVARDLIGSNVKAATAQLTFKMPGMIQSVDFHQDNGCTQLPTDPSCFTSNASMCALAVACAAQMVTWLPTRASAVWLPLMM